MALPDQMFLPKGVEPFRALAVAFHQLRSQHAAPAADRIGGEALVGLARLHPEFEFGFFLENPQQHGRAALQASLGEALVKVAGLCGVRGCRLGVAGRRHSVGGPGNRHDQSKNGQKHHPAQPFT